MKEATRVSAAEAAAVVQSGDVVDYGLCLGLPDVFDAALAARAAELRCVRVRSGVAVRSPRVAAVDPIGEHFRYESWHFSGTERKLHDDGRCHYIPMNFGELPDYYRRFIERVDVACIKTCAMDGRGFFNFGAAVAAARATIERARIVIVETSRAMPYMYGSEESVHASEVDFVVEGDDAPLAELVNPPISAVDQRVAELIAAEVEDGACLQIGIGGMPNAVCSLLKTSGARALGIHTEMFVDGMVDLIEAGLVTGARKRLDPRQSVCTFALGSQRMYRFLDHHPRVIAKPVDYTNLPHHISQNDRVVSINNTTQMDLQGQAASESSGHRHLTGTGGQLQFVRGAYASAGGKSFMCLASTYEKRGERCSRIVTALTPGNIVTTPRTDVMYVVTEYGLVNLKGKSVAERARALIGLAHPDFREDLERDAREKQLLPRGFV